jgi:DNA polymerase-1
MKTYLLIDSHALLHRAFHAMPFLQNKHGVPSGALFGLTNMILSAVERFKPAYILAANDLPGQTIREMSFASYKQNRGESDDKLVAQIKLMPEVFGAFGVPLVSKEGYEADDVIGTFVKKIQNTPGEPTTKGSSSLSKRGEVLPYKIIILTGDMDIMQLVDDDRVVVYTGKKGEEDVIFNEEEVFKKHGLKPKQIPDYKGLRGDTSDNIPGIKGIGEKTALTIIQKAGSLENVYKLIKEEDKDREFFGLSERFFELLKNGEDEAEFSKELATINCDLDVELPNIPEFKLADHVEKIKELCEEYNFTSIRKKLDGGKKIEKVEEKDLNKFVEVEGEESVALTSLPEGEGPRVGPALEFDSENFKKLQIAVWVLNSVETNIDKERLQFLLNNFNKHGLSPLSEGEGSGVRPESQVLEFFEKKLKEENLYDVYEKIELPLLPILDEANKVGVKLDREKLKKLLTRYEKEREKLQEEIYKLAGESFNLNSPKQLGVVLFEKLKVQEAPPLGGGVGVGVTKKIKKTAGGKLSTKFEVLEEMKENHKIVQMILDFREREKMINTYLEPLLVYSQFDDRIHTTFIQTGAQTGRFSSINPNMQNIPVRGEEGVELRECFIADTGKVLLAADYSQIELRIAAMLSGEEYLQKVFEEGKDIHKSVAVKMFKKEEAQITKDDRNAAKAMNFGILYGMGVTSIKNTLKVERNVAQAFYDSYTMVLPNLMKYLKDTVQYAKDMGYTETLYGRRRRIPEITSNIPMIRASGERFAMNAPIQGTSADIIKLAMSDFREVCVEKGWTEEWDEKTREKICPKVAFVLQVHDELIYEVDESIKKEVGVELKKVMEGVLQKHKPKHKYLPVPIVANVKLGKNWGEM